jgi:hypothetical protein
MYRALSQLSDATGIVDEFTTPFGFRWFSWSASQGFSLVPPRNVRERNVPERLSFHTRIACI